MSKKISEYTVPSQTTPGHYHQVFVTDDGLDWQCDCSWGQRHSGDNNIKRCWHAQLVTVLELAEDLLGSLSFRTMDEARSGNLLCCLWLLEEVLHKLAARGEFHKAADCATMIAKLLTAISVQGAYQGELDHKIHREATTPVALAPAA